MHAPLLSSLHFSSITDVNLIVIYCQEWERPKPGRRPDIFPKFSPMKTPLPPPMPYDPPAEDEEEEEEKKEEEEENPDQEEEEQPEKQQQIFYSLRENKKGWNVEI